MTKAKLNIIKLNIITVILTLICISCAPLSKSDPKVNESTNSGLKEIGKKIETQENQHNMKMAEIINEKSDLLDTFIDNDAVLVIEDDKIRLKKIIYSSLDYQKEKIETLKEIIETLKKNPEKNNSIIRSFLYNIALGIQFRIETNLKSLNEKQDNLSKEDLEELQKRLKSDLELKERFKKTLNETLAAYKQDDQGIKNDEVKLAEHFNQYYKDTNTLRPLS
ncbi:complement regulator-acquiring protein [Borreliella bissettiae]|uniref:Borrelia PFam54 protein n=1 Tax=Borrelia bissettiae (strain DSM 17990 / CIP 109136 / DN127) TaxID=521010 RepID=G0API6_BORBD|nr:complement regulator-acquiring protein [Borreliella bissettiae]AEL19612.1 borrelia PFam54 protein [Borreliella bissettiae DN127]WKD00365.1 complement regulator-acquiring protein [Borreliella bissettiae]